MLGTVSGVCPSVRAAEIELDLSGWSDTCGVHFAQRDSLIEVHWPAAADQIGTLVVDLAAKAPLVQQIRLESAADGEQSARDRAALTGLEPFFAVTVGSRVAPEGRPPRMSPFNTFFDNPAQRPHVTHRLTRALSTARVQSLGRRARLELGPVDLGPFHGALWFTFFADTPLIQAEAVVSTRQADCAMFYDAGWLDKGVSWEELAWDDVKDQPHDQAVDLTAGFQPLAVRRRMLAMGGGGLALACFPPPHQFMFPRDWTDNLGFCWQGAGHHGEPAFGVGIRQSKDGGGNFVPWFNAPPGTKQHLGMFLWLTRGSPREALAEAARLTHGDRFTELPGHLTFTSHFHLAHAVQTLDHERQHGGPPTDPVFVRIFKELGVRAVHLAEFHGDGHQKDPGPIRLKELATMFQKCRRLSDDDLLLIPGEEVNDFLGVPGVGRHPGHWMALFPRPVYWTMDRPQDGAFQVQTPMGVPLYRVANRQDMLKLLEIEGGLAWTAHPRIKASSWTPDIFRNEDFYLSPHWLGAAWKAMPGDLSREKLGERALDLLDDMANWGEPKYLPGEVDVFQLETTHEVYGHMNVNYLELADLPRYEQGWQPILDCLRSGKFFVTTGEVLLSEFRAQEAGSGDTLELPAGGEVRIQAQLGWTFPLSFAEIISGDGKQVYREPIDLTDTACFGEQRFSHTLKLAGRKWVRLEVWDVAANGAYSQPIWLK